MKTKTTTPYVFLFIGIVLILAGCKKEERLQPRWLWLIEPMYIMTETAQTHEDNKTEIGEARQTLKVHTWNGDTVTGYYWNGQYFSVPGPAGYNALADKATEILVLADQEETMPDTLEATAKGDLGKIKEKYLELRRKYDADKAWRKLRLAVPKKFYKVYPYYCERKLSEYMKYLTGQLGGSAEWYSGIADVTMEKCIRNLMTQPDPNDPWGDDCSAETHYWFIYQDEADGPDKASLQTLSTEMIEFEAVAQSENRLELARKAHLTLVHPETGEIMIQAEDLKTKTIIEKGEEYIVLDIPVQ